MRTLTTTAAATLLLSLPATAQAQGAEWDYRLTLYGWTAGLDTSVETPRGTLESDMSIHDVLSDLSVAFMGTFEARNGRWGLIADLVYADITTSEDTPYDTLFSKVAVEPKLTALTGLAAYRLYDNGDFAADLLAGFRYVNLDTEVRFSSGAAPGRTYASKDDWVDPVIGFRVAGNISDRWLARAAADAGGHWNGDSSTWQALAVVGYSFNPTWSAEFGYRHMHIENKIDGSDVLVDLSGPMIGVTARF